MRPLERTGADLHLGDAEEASLEAHLVLGPQPLDRLERLLEAGAALLPLDAEGLELDVPVADAEAEDHAAAADDVEGRDLLGHVDGIEERQQEDPGEQPHVAA